MEERWTVLSNGEKKYRVFTSMTKRMYDWLNSKDRPEHMSKSCAMEHYFWLGIEYERLLNDNNPMSPTNK